MAGSRWQLASGKWQVVLAWGFNPRTLGRLDGDVVRVAPSGEADEEADKAPALLPFDGWL